MCGYCITKMSIKTQFFIIIDSARNSTHNLGIPTHPGTTVREISRCQHLYTYTHTHLYTYIHIHVYICTHPHTQIETVSLIYDNILYV